MEGLKKESELMKLKSADRYANNREASGEECENLVEDSGGA